MTKDEVIALASYTWGTVEPLVESITGYLESGQPMALYGLAKATSGDILEIGAFRGKSTACLALACLGTSKRVYSIDPFRRQPTPEYSDPTWDYSLNDWQHNMDQLGVGAITHPMVGLSEELAPTWDKTVGMLFIDGAHAYENVVADFNNYFKWLTPGGILTMHDVRDFEPWLSVLRVWQENALPNLVGVMHFSGLAVGFKK